MTLSPRCSIMTRLLEEVTLSSKWVVCFFIILYTDAMNYVCVPATVGLCGTSRIVKNYISRFNDDGEFWDSLSCLL